MSTIKVIWEPVARLRFLRSLHERIHIMNYHSYSQPVKVFFSLTSPLWQSTPIVLMHVYPYDLTDAFFPLMKHANKPIYEDPYHRMSQMENSARLKCRLYLRLTLRWRGHTYCTYPAAELPS